MNNQIEKIREDEMVEQASKALGIDQLIKLNNDAMKNMLVDFNDIMNRCVKLQEKIKEDDYGFNNSALDFFTLGFSSLISSMGDDCDNLYIQRERMKKEIEILVYHMSKVITINEKYADDFCQYTTAKLRNAKDTLISVKQEL